MTKKRTPTKTKQPPYIFIAAIILAVVVMGLIAANRNGGQSDTASAAVQLLRPADYVAQFQQPAAEHVLIDVRTPEEFASGHIAGAINIPVDEVSQRLAEFPTDQPVVLYCRSGNRSAQAASILTSAGYNNLYDLGGIIDWQAQGLPVQ
ncbi:MAG: rhodanese-like domain-containing protein [Chloroflexi bacterium]|nr:rhodanese-like domain-containing protein [Chloroflexota bacterium]